MTEIVWPCGGHKYDDVGVVCGACHDAEVSRLKAQLASMTKRAEEAEKTCDDYMIDIEALGRKGDAAEVKLAMAVQGLQRVTRSDYFHAQRAIAEDTLRALGVEPGEVGR